MEIDPGTVKLESEAAIRAAGGRICDWLPHLDVTPPRSRDELVGRSLAMNALIHVAHGAPRTCA